MDQRLLIVGVGSIGERHLRCFRRTGRVDCAICEPNAELRQGVAKRYGVTRAYGSLDEALEDKHDLAVIATPAPLHVPMATRLAEAGLHLLIEKPLGTSHEGIDALRAVIAGRGVTVAIGYTMRSHPVLADVKRVLDEGRFGRPLQITAVSGSDFAFFRPAYRTIYYARHESGGGAVQDAMTHLANAGEWLVGPMTRLTADIAHQKLEGVEVEDTVHLIARQGPAGAGEVLGSYSLNQYQAPAENIITVVCKRGTVRAELHLNRWRWMNDPAGAWTEVTFEVPERDTLYVNQAQAFLDAVEGKRPPLCTLDEAQQTLRVNLAALESAKRGQWVDL